jgi:hypothetical protein
MNKWQDLAATSHYLTAVKIKQALNDGEIEDARLGIQELTDAMSRADRRAVRSQLVRLMKHIIKWKTQPTNRSVSWAVSIENSRSEIEALREDTASITRAEVESLWEKCFQQATKEAEIEMSVKNTVHHLTWHDVFEAEYSLTKK